MRALVISTVTILVMAWLWSRPSGRIDDAADDRDLPSVGLSRPVKRPTVERKPASAETSVRKTISPRTRFRSDPIERPEILGTDAEFTPSETRDVKLQSAVESEKLGDAATDEEVLANSDFGRNPDALSADEATTDEGPDASVSETASSGGGPSFANASPFPTSSDQSDDDQTGGGAVSSGGGGGTSAPGAITLSSETCTASVGSGSYPTAQTISLSCTGGVTPRYCVAQDTCCDPSSGTTYATPITVGADNTTFCLSVQGVATQTQTAVAQFSYDFIPGIADISITLTNARTWYQTTELLDGSYQLETDRFGTANNFVGALNLFTNDPGPAGLATTCADLQNDYLTYTPAPVEVLAPTDASAIVFGSTLDIFLRPIDLDYGENFIVTYVDDQTPGLESFSCSTTKLTLRDFPYFTSQVSHGELGTNQGRIFEASFESYGHFETAGTVLTQSSGAATSSTGQRFLSSGLFATLF